jgi:hypothetical protein
MRIDVGKHSTIRRGPVCPLVPTTVPRYAQCDKPVGSSSCQSMLEGHIYQQVESDIHGQISEIHARAGRLIELHSSMNLTEGELPTNLLYLASRGDFGAIGD